MKGIKKITSVILAVMMLALMLSSCGGNGETKTTAEGTTKATESTKADSTTKATEATKTEQTTEAATESGEYKFPDGANLSVWIEGLEYDAEIGISTRSDMLCWQVIEEMTGVKIDWVEPTYGTKADSLAILLASDELPDLFFSKISDFSAFGGLSSLIDQGIILDLTEYIDKYMPNYASYLYSSEEYQRATVTADGKIGMIIPFIPQPEGPWLGYVVRKDWLDDLGLDVPVTYDDWHEMLTKFKEEKGATSALWLNSRASDQEGIFGAAFGITGLGMDAENAFFQKDGKVYYSCLEQGYKDYVTMIAQWYSEGLIDPDFYTTNITRCEKDMANIAGKTGGCASSITNIAAYAEKTGVEGMEWIPVDYPVLTEGQQLHNRIVGSISCDEGWVISADCENVELACRWLDALWTTDAVNALNYGKEGVTFEIVDGKPQFTELVTNNPDGLTLTQAKDKYADATSMLYDWTRIGQTEDALYVKTDLWIRNNDGSYVIKNKSLTTEESEEWASIMADVDTAAVEWTIKFVTGQKSIEKEWDEFISTIKGMGIERAIEFYQAGVDRYMDLPVREVK